MKLRVVIVTAGSVLAMGCGEAPPQKATAATIGNAVSEAQLTTVTLSQEAFDRLGIATTVVESTTVAPTRTVGGEIIVPPGQSLIVSAPVAGRVVAPDDGGIPQAGARVAARQPIMQLIALPPDRDLLRTQQEVTVAEARLRQAQAEATRTARLFADRLVSERDNEAAAADLEAARAARDAAVAQQNMMSSGAPLDAKGLTPIRIAAPDAGMVRIVHVAAGQAVAAGAPLAEIVRLDRLWVRVPVYAGDASRIARGTEATVHGLAGPMSGPAYRASAVAAPPSADAASASVDLFYEIRGGSGSLRPGERVGITLPLQAGTDRALVVPLSAVVYDMNGGAWVYEQAAPLTFTRRRVDIVRVVSGKAVLARGPTPGTTVVTDGAAELFGTEFGPGK